MMLKTFRQALKMFCEHFKIEAPSLGGGVAQSTWRGFSLLRDGAACIHCNDWLGVGAWSPLL